VGIDTEADDQWSARGREQMSVRNAERLPALQALFEEHGVRPTYVVTWEMATRPESAEVLRGLARSGRCEIGTHLHPWSSPPFRPEDLARHTYPHNLPPELLDRQITELTAAIEDGIGVRPTTYRAGRNGFDGGTLPILERLGYTVDTSVDPLFNERRKGGMVFAGAPVGPYRPDYADVRRPGASRILEIPITSATTPALPKAVEAAYAQLDPIPWRGAIKRLGLRPVWLRPSYTPLADMLAFADRLAAGGARCFNIIFHSSEVLPGGSPYTPDEASVARFLDDLRRLLAHLTDPLGAQGRTYAEFAREWAG
jgi:peptidoglycan/xylan/chitin deacetylase (PgdA/CDA1 family)